MMSRANLLSRAGVRISQASRPAGSRSLAQIQIGNGANKLSLDITSISSNGCAHTSNGLIIAPGNAQARAFGSQFLNAQKRAFSSEGKPVVEAAGSTVPKDQEQNMDVGNMLVKLAPWVILNPLTVGTGVIYFYMAYIGADETDPRNAKQGSSFIAATRQARRESLSDFKEHVWQNPDPKEDYDERTFRRHNYTTLVKTNTFRPGVKEREEKAAADAAAGKKIMRKKTSAGLYDSEGRADKSRVSEGIRAHALQVEVDKMEKTELLGHAPSGRS